MYSLSWWMEESGIMNCAPDDFKPTLKRADNYLIFPNGAKASFFSSNDPDSLRGPQFHFAWCDELAKWRYAQDTWDNLQMALRLGNNPRQIVTTTPRPRPLLHNLKDDPDVIMTHATTYQNAQNLAPKYLDIILKKYKNTRYGRQEINGELLSGHDGALWSRDLLDRIALRQNLNLNILIVLLWVLTLLLQVVKMLMNAVLLLLALWPTRKRRTTLL